MIQDRLFCTKLPHDFLFLDITLLSYIFSKIFTAIFSSSPWIFHLFFLFLSLSISYSLHLLPALSAYVLHKYLRSRISFELLSQVMILFFFVIPRTRLSISNFYCTFLMFGHCRLSHPLAYTLINKHLIINDVCFAQPAVGLLLLWF